MEDRDAGCKYVKGIILVIDIKIVSSFETDDSLIDHHLNGYQLLRDGYSNCIQQAHHLLLSINSHSFYKFSVCRFHY
jgi:hypothetical protein